MKKFSLALAISTASLLAGVSAMPPMPPSFPKAEEKKRPFPKSCKSIPMMIVHLPPPMELEFNSCKNDLHMPTDSAVARAVIGWFGPKAVFKSISVAEDFFRLYQVDFTIGENSMTIYTNEKLSKFLISPESK
jgi:hypothetical protein